MPVVRYALRCKRGLNEKTSLHFEKPKAEFSVSGKEEGQSTGLPLRTFRKIKGYFLFSSIWRLIASKLSSLITCSILQASSVACSSPTPRRVSMTLRTR